MNVLCSLQVILVFVYSIVIETAMDSMSEKDEFADVETPLLLFDLLNSFESLLYLLMAISQIKTLVFWLPDTFRIVVELFAFLLNR